MSTTSAKRNQIAASLMDKEYRDLFVAEEISTGLAFQVRRMREARNWSQRDLAERAGMTQEGISRLENPDYGRFTLTTLNRLASAFDVALIVRFAPFGELVDRAAHLSPEDLAVPDFAHDPGLVREANHLDNATNANRVGMTDGMLTEEGVAKAPEGSDVAFASVGAKRSTDNV